MTGEDTSAAAGESAPPEAEEFESPMLAIQFRGHSVDLAPTHAIVIRDVLRSLDGDVERRLLTVLEAKTTELLAAPLYAGRLTLRIDREEEAVLLTVARRWVQAGHRVDESPALVRLWAELDGRVDSSRDTWATDAAVVALVDRAGTVVSDL